MKNNLLINTSRTAYALLLKLYPKGHYKEYGPDMLQLFKDECKSVKNIFDLVYLWFRTLCDLTINILKEHITSPGFSMGLLESPANSALPWKGVVLVLIPGLVFFIGQAGQLNGQDWFFWLTYRAAYYLMIPVILVWIWQKRFPVWGLIPLGLLFKTLLSLGNRLIYLTLDENNPLFFFSTRVFTSFSPNLTKITIMTVLLLAILISFIYVNRMKKTSRSTWIWLGIFLALILLNMMITFPGYLMGPLYQEDKPAETMSIIIDFFYNEVYTHGGFLALILGGVLLMRRHGKLAALLPLGYLLPTILYGRISNEWPDPATAEFTFMFTVSSAALIYRFMVAIVAPLWVVRSAAGQMKRIAGIISLITLLLFQLVFSLTIPLNTFSNPSLINGITGDQSLVFITRNINLAIENLSQNNSLNPAALFFVVQQVFVQSAWGVLLSVIIQQLIIGAGIALVLSVNRLFKDDETPKKEYKILYEGVQLEREI